MAGAVVTSVGVVTPILLYAYGLVRWLEAAGFRAWHVTNPGTLALSRDPPDVLVVSDADALAWELPSSVVGTRCVMLLNDWSDERWRAAIDAGAVACLPSGAARL